MATGKENLPAISLLQSERKEFTNININDHNVKTSSALNLLFKYQYFRGRFPDSENMPQTLHSMGK